MKREHVYRGQSVNTGKWVYGSVIHCGEEITSTIINDKCEIEVITNTVSQYIGQEDKTGKRIFEYDFYREEDMLYVCLYSEEIAGFCWISELEYWTFIEDGFLHLDDSMFPYNCSIEDTKIITIASNIIDKPLKLGI